MRPAPATTLLGPLTLISALLGPLLPGCGAPADPGNDGGAEGGDGKVHPPGNGHHESEAAACDALNKAQDAHNTTLMCASTSRPCPSLIQVQAGGAACLEYDQGSVQGCVDYYGTASTCDTLATAIASCEVISFPGSAPKGCP